MKYDYLIVGSGLFAATFAFEMTKHGKKCLVIEKRNHVGGNVYCEKINNINVHKYGPHIFHTSNKEIWQYVNQFTEFNNFVNQPLACYKNEIYNLPFNMNLFVQLWRDVKTPEDAMNKITSQVKSANITEPKNLEEFAISQVGKDIYDKFIKEYTEKQWGRPCDKLPMFIIKRIPVRYTFNNNYFNDIYQGIPVLGYNHIIEKMLEKCDVILNVNYNLEKDKYKFMAKKVLYTGMIDEYFNYEFGPLDYRSLKFENEIYSNIDNYQGNAVVNYTDKSVKYTRIVEHKFFENNTCKGTIITKEYPFAYDKSTESYYPVNDDKNNSLYEKYRTLCSKEKDVLFGGRLGDYKYYNMDETIEKALALSKVELNEK